MAKKKEKAHLDVFHCPNGVEAISYNIRMSIIEAEGTGGYIFQLKKFIGNMPFDPNEPIATDESFERGIYFMNMAMSPDTLQLMHLLLGELMEKKGIKKL